MTNGDWARSRRINNQLLWKAVEDRLKLDFQETIIFFILYQSFLFFHVPDIHEIGSETTMDWDALCFNVATLIAGVFVLDYGADKFIDHTVIVGRRLGISQTVIALLTAGAEWEEVCNSVQSDSISILANPFISSRS
jgi:hypothetical protein